MKNNPPKLSISDTRKLKAINRRKRRNVTPKRKNNYKNPALYSKHLGVMRDKYRKKANISPSSPIATGKLEDYATSRRVLLGDSSSAKCFTLLTFNNQELANLLGISEATLFRWVRKGQLPRPMLVTDLGALVWYIEEVRCFKKHLLQHLSEFCYYRADHRETQRRIYHDVTLVRRKQLRGK